jgi:hypothetical protein
MLHKRPPTCVIFGVTANVSCVEIVVAAVANIPKEMNDVKTRFLFVIKYGGTAIPINNMNILQGTAYKLLKYHYAIGVCAAR